ncbi:MAG: epimerase [Acidiphilium sp. 21-60-14]|nr:MAG: epimerase [Acidiphilium sp. 21-60-14]OYV91263.1 MAG: epimerase [Acidiphilium sp. 37-60-79]OZB39889.1 MAG: epimerase [Acidiphilium sp. 34-60-192]
MPNAATLSGPVLVSGAAGFVGRAVTQALGAAGCSVVVALRRSGAALPGAARAIDAGDLAAPAPALSAAMRGVSVVVHAAGLAHRTGVDPAALAAANVTAAARVAEIAAARGAKRFILVSSAAVHGKAPDGVVTEASEPDPDDAYAASKLEGEQAVQRVLAGTGTELVIIRPCAVVGPGCAGNIPRLVRLIARSHLLPFGAIGNQRSFIAIEDLAALIVAAAQSKQPVPEIVLAAHPEPIATPDLIRALAQGLERRLFLAPVPASWLGLAARAANQGPAWRSFAGSFRAHPILAQQRLGFTAQIPLEAAFAATARTMVL